MPFDESLEHEGVEEGSLIPSPASARERERKRKLTSEEDKPLVEFDNEDERDRFLAKRSLKSMMGIDPNDTWNSEHNPLIWVGEFDGDD